MLLKVLSFANYRERNLLSCGLNQLPRAVFVKFAGLRVTRLLLADLLLVGFLKIVLVSFSAMKSCVLLTPKRDLDVHELFCL